MSSVSASLSGLSASVALAADRLIPASVADAEERARAARAVTAIVAAPFLLAVACATAIATGAGVGAALALSLAGFTLAWVALALIASGRTGEAVQAAGLTLAAMVLAALLVLAGGLASPLALLFLALPLEALWIAKSRPLAFRAAIAAAWAVLTAGVLLGWGGLAAHIAAPSVLHWITPLAYGATLWPRLSAMTGSSAALEGLKVDRAATISAVFLDIAPNGDILEAEGNIGAMLRLPDEMLRGASFFERILVGDRVAYLSAVAELGRAPGRRIVEVRLRLPARAGDMQDTYAPFRLDMMTDGKEGSPIRAVLTDNIAVQTLREALSAANRELESTEIAKSRFLAAVSHELRTPLNAIIGFSDMLLCEMFGGFVHPKQKEYVRLVKESGDHLLSVVNSILDVSKIEAGTYTIETEPFALQDAIETCRSMMEGQAAAKGIAIETNAVEFAGMLCADRRAVQQILINLLSNAVKFTPDGGRVRIGARSAGGRVRLWVSDTGIGIEACDLDRLGSPFMQVQNDYTRRYEGTGLGLSLVKGLVALHEGAMSIESAPGAGTTVTITLPVEGPRKPAARPVDDPAPMAETLEVYRDEPIRKTA